MLVRAGRLGFVEVGEGEMREWLVSIWRDDVKLSGLGWPVSYT